MTRCEAIKKNGERCEREDMPHSHFCWQHDENRVSPSRSSPSRAAPSRESPSRAAPSSPKQDKSLYFYESQSAAKCGQHALNNLFGNIRKGRLPHPLFVSTKRKDGIIREKIKDKETFDLQSFCLQRASLLENEIGEIGARARRDIACYTSGNYDVYLLSAAAKSALGDSVLISDVIYRGSEKRDENGVKHRGEDFLLSDMENTSGRHRAALIVNYSGYHYVCVVRIHHAWFIIDSIGGRPKSSYSTAQEVMNALIKKKFRAAFSIIPI